MRADYKVAFFAFLLECFCGMTAVVHGDVRRYEYSRDILEIASFEPGKLIVYAKERDVCWLNVTPMGLQETSLIQLAQGDSVKRILGDKMFSVLWLARNQDAFNAPRPAKRLLRSFAAGAGKLLNERILKDGVILSNVASAKREISHESIVESWQLSLGKEDWHLHAVDRSMMYLDSAVAIYDDVAIADHVREIKVLDLEKGKTERFLIPPTARLAAATAQRGEWRFYVYEGGSLRLYSKGVAQPNVRQIDNLRQVRGFPGGCIVETEENIMVFPWAAESKPWIVRKRDGLEWTFGGNERYGVAAVIGDRKIFQFDWITEEGKK